MKVIKRVKLVTHNEIINIVRKSQEIVIRNRSVQGLYKIIVSLKIEIN